MQVWHARIPESRSTLWVKRGADDVLRAFAGPLRTPPAGVTDADAAYVIRARWVDRVDQGAPVGPVVLVVRDGAVRPPGWRRARCLYRVEELRRRDWHRYGAVVRRNPAFRPDELTLVDVARLGNW